MSDSDSEIELHTCYQYREIFGIATSENEDFGQEISRDDIASSDENNNIRPSLVIAACLAQVTVTLLPLPVTVEIRRLGRGIAVLGMCVGIG